MTPFLLEIIYGPVGPTWGVIFAHSPPAPLIGVTSEFGKNRTLNQRRGVVSRKPSFATNLVEKAERPSGNVRFGSQKPFSIGKAMNSEFQEDQAASSTRISM